MSDNEKKSKALNASDDLVKKEAAKKQEHAVRRINGDGNNQSYIATVVCDASKGNFGEETDEDKRKKKLNATLKLSGKIFQDHMGDMAAQAAYHQEMADEARANAAEIRDSQEYKDAIQDVEDITDAVESGDPDRMKAELEKRGINTKGMSKEDIERAARDEMVKAMLILAAYDKKIADWMAEADEHDKARKTIEAEAKDIAEKVDAGMDEENAVIVSKENLAAAGVVLGDSIDQGDVENSHKLDTMRVDKKDADDKRVEVAEAVQVESKLNAFGTSPS